MKVKVSNAWKDGVPWVKVSGSWKKAIAEWVKVNGVWKKVVYGFYKITGTTAKVKLERDNPGTSYERRQYSQESRAFTPTPSNYPMDDISFYVYRTPTRTDAAYFRLGFDDETERKRLQNALISNTATVSITGPFTLTLNNSNCSVNQLAGRVELVPDDKDVLYNLLRDWVGKPLEVAINIKD